MPDHPAAVPSLPVPAHDASPGEAPTARVDSAALLGGARQLVIVHGGREYRLRVTQNGKLILTA